MMKNRRQNRQVFMNRAGNFLAFATAGSASSAFVS